VLTCSSLFHMDPREDGSAWEGYIPPATSLMWERREKMQQGQRPPVICTCCATVVQQALQLLHVHGRPALLLLIGSYDGARRSPTPVRTLTCKKILKDSCNCHPAVTCLAGIFENLPGAPTRVDRTAIWPTAVTAAPCGCLQYVPQPCALAKL
jgi:hypothetical protein